jgi:hypothetical protein
MLVQKRIIIKSSATLLTKHQDIGLLSVIEVFEVSRHDKNILVWFNWFGLFDLAVDVLPRQGALCIIAIRNVCLTTFIQLHET